jgi:hypothetical protein
MIGLCNFPVCDQVLYCLHKKLPVVQKERWGKKFDMGIPENGISAT